MVLLVEMMGERDGELISGTKLEGNWDVIQYSNV